MMAPGVTACMMRRGAREKRPAKQAFYDECSPIFLADYILIRRPHGLRCRLLAAQYHTISTAESHRRAAMPYDAMRGDGGGKMTRHRRAKMR